MDFSALEFITQFSALAFFIERELNYETPNFLFHAPIIDLNFIR